MRVSYECPECGGKVKVVRSTTVDRSISHIHRIQKLECISCNSVSFATVRTSFDWAHMQYIG